MLKFTVCLVLVAIESSIYCVQGQYLDASSSRVYNNENYNNENSNIWSDSNNNAEPSYFDAGDRRPSVSAQNYNTFTGTATGARKQSASAAVNIQLPTNNVAKNNKHKHQSSLSDNIGNKSGAGKSAVALTINVPVAYGQSSNNKNNNVPQPQQPVRNNYDNSYEQTSYESQSQVPYRAANRPQASATNRYQPNNNNAFANNNVVVVVSGNTNTNAGVGISVQKPHARPAYEPVYSEPTSSTFDNQNGNVYQAQRPTPIATPQENALFSSSAAASRDGADHHASATNHAASSGIFHRPHSSQATFVQKSKPLTGNVLQATVIAPTSNAAAAAGVKVDVSIKAIPKRDHSPRRASANRYNDFKVTFYDIGRQTEPETFDRSQEDSDSNDDFNGRSVVAPGQYPHMAALGFPTATGQIEFKCGGSLISDTFVLTAAHCCASKGKKPTLVKIGDINLKKKERETAPQRRNVAEISVHPLYNESMNYHDIALIRLEKAVKITKFVRPIRLWARDEILYDKLFTMGYGSTSFSTAPTNILTELSLSVVPLDKCNRTMPYDEGSPAGIVDSQICAQDFVGNRDTCQGDSGGPLQLNLERKQRRHIIYYLVGITSYGTACRTNYPGIYTRVSSYLDWIAYIVWPNYFKDN